MNNSRVVPSWQEETDEPEKNFDILNVRGEARLAALQSAPHAIAQTGEAKAQWKIGAFISLALTFAAFVIHAYHPYAEDGGVYLTGVKHLLYPALYPAWSGFATAHLRYELFAPMVALLVRTTGISLMAVMLALYLVGIWATLFAGWLIASRCTASPTGRLGAVSVLALTLTIPVAGTSLMLMDPYVTARTISTPCGMLALVGALDAIADLRFGRALQWKSVALCVAGLAIAVLAHPLMAAYSFGCVLLLIASSPRNRRVRRIAIAAICIGCFAAAACLAGFSPAVSSAYTRVALTRSYWFVATWHWYEQFGLIAPLLVLILLARSTTAPAAKDLARMAVATGVTALAVAFTFARVSSAGSIVARLQPLRSYQTIYILMLLALGAFLGERVLRDKTWRWAVLFVALGPSMYFVQDQTFPHSTHIEIPWTAPSNQWQQGFLWIRNNTPVSAVFAIDADYINAPGEDAQNFRAIAERSVLPDYEKDGGIASIAPDLTPDWTEGENLQQQLNNGVGPAQISRLRSVGVDWVALAANTPTTLSCAYANQAMKVCPLPR